jgi:hypothetical protein
MEAAMSSGSPIFCGRCLAPVKLMIDASWVSIIVCPSCGQTDTFSNAFKEADEYAAAYFRGEITDERGQALQNNPLRRFRFVPRYLVDEI